MANKPEKAFIFVDLYFCHIVPPWQHHGTCNRICSAKRTPGHNTESIVHRSTTNQCSNKRACSSYSRTNINNPELPQFTLWIKKHNWIVLNIGVKICIPSIKINRIPRRPSSYLRIIIPGAEASELGVAVVNAARVTKGLVDS